MHGTRDAPAKSSPRLVSPPSDWTHPHSNGGFHLNMLRTTDISCNPTHTNPPIHEGLRVVCCKPSLADYAGDEPVLPRQLGGLGACGCGTKTEGILRDDGEVEGRQPAGGQEQRPGEQLSSLDGCMATF